MKCPVDNTTLLITDRNGVEIDYCPECRGVWLDRGELDKLIERAGSYASTPAPRVSQSPRYEEPHSKPQERHEHYDEHHDSYDRHNQNKKRKKESFLGDLFDF